MSAHNISIKIDNPSFVQRISKNKKSYGIHLVILVSVVMIVLLAIYIFKQFNMVFYVSVILLGYIFLCLRNIFRFLNISYEFDESEILITKGKEIRTYSFKDVCYFNESDGDLFFCLLFKGELIPQSVYNVDSNLKRLFMIRCPYASMKKSYKECRKISKKFDVAWKATLVLTIASVVLPIFMIQLDSRDIRGVVMLFGYTFSYISAFLLYIYMENRRIEFNLRG